MCHHVDLCFIVVFSVVSDWWYFQDDDQSFWDFSCQVL